MIRTLTFAAATGAAAIVAAGALSAAAQTAPTGPQGTPAPDGHMMMMMMHHHLAEMDKNHDGYITRDEFLARPAELFARFDTNGDGRLSREELAAAHREHKACKQQGPGDAAARDVPCGAMGAMHGMGGHGEHMAMMRRHMDRLDTDHDGRISFAELEAPLRRHFEMMDKNKDGFIEKDELPAGHMAAEKHVEPHD